MNAEAWLLHKSPSGDTSARLSLFTRDQGIVTCLYRGGRTAKKQAILQPFIPLWLFLDSKRDWHYVRSLETVSAPLPLKNNSLFCALYVNELLYYALKAFDPHPELYDVYEYTLKGLAHITEQVAMESLLRKFEWMLLGSCGYMLSFAENAAARYRFVAGKGFVVDRNGVPGEDVLAITRGQFEDVRVLKSAKLIMRQAVDDLLGGRELKTRALFTSSRGRHLRHPSG